MKVSATGMDDLRFPLHRRAEEREQVEVLVGLLVKALGARLCGDGHERRVVHVGVGHAGQEVGRARAERREAKPGLAAEPPLHVRHERGTLLVARLQEADLRVEERVEQRERLLARYAEGPVDALALEAADEQLRRGHRSRYGT